MHVVIVDEELPYPPNSGKRLRTFHLISRLAGRHHLTYICHRNADREEAERGVGVFRDLGIEPIVADRAVPSKSGPMFYARLAANLASPLPYSVASHTSSALRQAVRDYAARNRVDLWQAEWTPYAESLRDLVGVRRLIMAHNVESRIWQRYYETESHPARRWYIGQQWRKFERFERRVFAEADCVVAVSPDDAALIRQRSRAAQVAVVDNGVDTDRIRPGGADRHHGPILFLGGLDWRPNLDAVESLLNTVFPEVRAQEPSARLCIVGRNPPDWLRRRIAATPGTELHADVPDVRPYLAHSTVLVVPLRIGGGSRLKILEAFAAGLPVISTRLGAEGLCVAEGTHLCVVGRVEELAQAVVAHLRDPGRARGRVERGRRLVEERYDWKILSARLERLWCEAASGGRSVNLRSYISIN